MTTVADQIRGVLTAKAEALIRQDSYGLAALIHADFIYVNAGGRTFDRAGYIDAYCVSGNIVFLEQRVSGLEVVGFDGFAVARLNVDDRFAAGGQIVAGGYRSLCVFSMTNGQWLWAAGQTMARS